MKKILLLLIGLVSFSIASDQYQFVVENSAMVDAYFNIFNAIGAMLKNDDYVDLLRLTFLLGGFFVFVGTVLKSFSGESSGVSTIGPYAKYLMIVTALLTFVFSHKSELYVTTNQLPTYCGTQVTSGFAVSMPMTLAYVFSFTNTIGSNLTNIMESAFSQPTMVGSTSMQDSNGYLGSLKTAIQLLTVNPSRVTGSSVSGEQVNFAGTLQNHLNDCVYGVAQNKGKLGEEKIEEFQNSKEISLWLKNFLEFKFSTTEQKTGDYLTSVRGETLTCSQNFVYVEQALSKYKEKIACSLSTLNGAAMKLLTGDTNVNLSKMQEISLQAGLINSLEDSGNLNSIGISGADFSSGKTKVEFTQTQLASGQYLAEMLPMIQMVIRALLYALFPLIFVVMLLPGGINVMKQYAQTLLWVELWMPTAAVINMFINMNAEAKMSAVYKETGLTLITSIQMLEDSATIAGYGAYLYASVPALTWLILKGSGSMLGNITSGISAGFAGNMSTEKQAEDLSKVKASSASDKTITQLESLHYANKASQSYGEAVGYDKSGSMKPNMKVADISKQESTQAKLMSVLQAGGEASYLENQKQTAGYATEKAVTENKVTTSNGGDSAVRNLAEQSTGTALSSANSKKSYAGGSNENVSKIESNKNVNDLANTLGKLNNGSTTTTSYNVGSKAGAEEKGTSNVVDKKGTNGFKDSTEQTLSATSDTAETLKKDLGNNQNVANTTVYKNRVDALQADKTSKVLSADENADLGAKADQKQKFQTKGESAVLGNDMNKVANDSGMKGAMENKAELLKVDTNGDGYFSKKEMDNFQKIANTSAISDHASKEAKQKMLASNAEYFGNDKGRIGEIYKQNLDKYGDKTAAVAATMEAIEKDKKAVDAKINDKETPIIKNDGGRIGEQNGSEKEKSLEKFEKQSDNLQKDFGEMIGSQSQEIKEDLVSKGFSESEANTIVRDDLKKRNTYSENVTKQTLDSEMKELEQKRKEAYSANGVNSQNVGGMKKQLSTMKQDLEKNGDKLNSRAKENLTNSIKGLETKINNYQGGIDKEYMNKKVDKLAEYVANGFVDVDKNGKITYKDTVKEMKSMNIADRNVALSKIQGSLEGQKTSYVDFKGYTVDKIKNILGENTTHRVEATQSFSETGKFNRDILFHAVKNEYVDRKTVAVVNTGVDAVKSVVSGVGVAGKLIP